MKIIDSHVHLNLEQFDGDREEVFKRIEEKLDFVVNIGFDLESSEKSVEYANKYPFIYAVIGFHPDEIEGYSEEAEKTKSFVNRRNWFRLPLDDKTKRTTMENF